MRGDLAVLMCEAFQHFPASSLVGMLFSFSLVLSQVGRDAALLTPFDSHLGPAASAADWLAAVLSIANSLSLFLSLISS